MKGCVLFVLTSLATLLPTGSGCILLLNGWQPLSLEERTDLADIIVTGYVLRTYKHLRTEANTYSATVEVVSVLKGRHRLKRIVDRDRGGRSYNVSNFGDRRMCYADVDRGSAYVFYLTTFHGRLSAKYDDIFGAASDYSSELEDTVLAHLGWRPWGSWTSCSRTCGRGQQVRKRACRLGGICAGRRREKRRCNTFACDADITDLLSRLDLESLPKGVATVGDRPAAYYVTKEARLNISTYKLFPRGFPGDFSILFVAKPEVDNQGYLMTIRGYGGEILLGVRVGRDPRFLYQDHRGKPGLRKSPTFPVNLSDGQRHWIALSVRDRTVTLYLDCTFQISVPLLRVSYHVSPYSVTALGGQDLLESFQGEIEQLAIIPDPEAAKHQCMAKKVVPHNKNDKKQKQRGELTHLFRESELLSSPGADGKSRTRGVLQWGAWSGCSATCGDGEQTRTASCSDEKLELSDCNDKKKIREKRICTRPPCSAVCLKPCLNGGICVTPGICSCRHGYGGGACEKVLCALPCRYGGHCVKPDTCSCLRGYEGAQCQRAICHKPCNNGGTCIAPDVCKCTAGFAGVRCQKAICPRGCMNGGRCVAAGVCSCPSGFRGGRCQTPICFPPCQNEGVCSQSHSCQCPPGTRGKYCQRATCRSSQCLNGGHCSGRDTCACPPGYTGQRCQTAVCPKDCQHGGTCTAPGTCSCRQGFLGPQCQRKKCQYKRVVEPYRRKFRQKYEKVVTTRCSDWSWKTCTKTKISYKTVYRTFYRPTYRCR